MVSAPEIFRRSAPDGSGRGTRTRVSTPPGDRPVLSWLDQELFPAARQRGLTDFN